MWTSKLGNKYPMAWMQENDKSSQKQLKQLRSLSGNDMCADCGRQDNTWASVSHGVFICVTCSDVHRSVGTHVTKVKGCTGTYLWGPDELEKMSSVGNNGGNAIYGTEKVDPTASKERKQRFVVDKYEKLAFAGQSVSTVPRAMQKVMPTARQSEPSVQRADKLQVTNSMPIDMMSLSPPHLAKLSAPIVPSACEVPSSFFDEFFNEAEDSYFGSSSPLKSPMQGPESLRTYEREIDLETFLDSTLKVNETTSPAFRPIIDYPASLDPFSTSKATDDKDLFADWPDF